MSEARAIYFNSFFISRGASKISSTAAAAKSQQARKGVVEASHRRSHHCESLRETKKKH
jgi:hypothetical protein